jgi:N-acetylglucosamine-6-phosphate deacetylase
MSVGHTEADFTTTLQAFAAGVSHVTHLGNAMAGVDRRRPGPVAAAIVDGQVTVEVIADGVHTHRGFLSLVAATMGDRMVAVTDATAAAGMAPGSYRLGRAEVSVGADRVVLAGRPDTLAGSILTMDRAVAALVGSGVDVADAPRAATATPASLIGARGKGMLRAGAMPTSWCSTKTCVPWPPSSPGGWSGLRGGCWVWRRRRRSSRSRRGERRP